MNSNYLTSSALALLLGAESISATEMLACRSFIGGMKKVVGNKNLTQLEDGSSRPSSEMITDFIFETCAKTREIYSEEEFRKIKDQILIAGWGGLCATAEGRLNRKIKRGEKEKAFAFCTKRGADPKELQTMWNPEKILQDPAFEKIQFEGSKIPDGIYKNIKKVDAKAFYEGLGNVNYTTVNKMKVDGETVYKPSWAIGHPDLIGCDLQFDVGSGKLSLSLKGQQNILNIAFTDRDPEKAEWGEMRFAEKLVTLSDEEAFSLLLKKLSTLEEHVKNIDITEPTMAFGLTGKWREMGEDEGRILNLFREAVCTLFPWCENNEKLAFLVTGADEAKYGAQSFENIPGLYKAARLGGIRYFVSMESGNGSTQVVVTDIVGSSTVFEEEFKKGLEYRRILLGAERIRSFAKELRQTLSEAEE